MSNSRTEARARFDAQLRAAVLRYPEQLRSVANRAENMRAADRLSRATAQSDAYVGIESNRLTVLLGRNGSGKSLLLDSIRTAADPSLGFPWASLIFEVPAKEIHDDWLSASAMIDEYETDRYLSSRIDPPILSSISFELRGVFESIIVSGMNAPDVLAYFGATEDEVERWTRDCEGRPPEWLGHMGEVSESGRSWMLRDRSPELLLHAASVLPTNDSLHVLRPFDEHVLVPSAVDWLNTRDLRDTIMPAIRQFLESAVRIELLDGWTARLLAPFPSGGALKDYLNARSRTVSAWESEFESTDPEDVHGYEGRRRMVVPFPVGVLEIVDIGGVPHVASLPINLRSNLSAEVFDIEPGLNVEAGIDELYTGIWRETVEPIVEHDDEETRIRVSPSEQFLSVLALAAELARHCDVGIHDISSSSVSHVSGFQWSLDLGFDHKISKAISRFAPPALRWLDGNSGQWLPVGLASLGQKQVVAISLLLARLRLLPSGRASSTILIGDEFDRHLHPNASRSLLELLAEEVQSLPGCSAIVSSHNVPALSTGPLLGAARIFARRGAQGFEYLSGSDVSLDTLHELLGSSTLEAWRLAKLFVVVEGEHDEQVVGNLLQGQLGDVHDVRIVNPHGMYAWEGVFTNALRFMDAPVLFVHDKRNLQLEEEWAEYRDGLLRNRRLMEWGGRLSKLLVEVKKRRVNRQWMHGDTELEQVLHLLRGIVGMGESLHVGRIHLGGLECHDIVDLLPISAFPRAASRFDTWDSAHEEFDGRISSDRDGRRFKVEYGINSNSVAEALKSTQDVLHPELARLHDTIMSLLNSGKKSA